MTEAVIVSTARTPLCKSWRGALNMTHGAKMGGHVVHAALERARVDADEVEDVIIGCANPEGATGWNIARQIAVRAGCPSSVPGMTVNRFCSSGLQTIALASQRILAGEGEIYVAGGVESISLVQNEMNKHHFQDEWLHRHKPESYWPMLQTAEYVARRYEIPREEQDRFGVQSQQRAAKARAEGKFKDEIAPITTKMKLADKNSGAEAPRADRQASRRHRPVGAERGLRGAGALLPRPHRHPRRAAQRQRRGDRARPPLRHERRAAHRARAHRRPAPQGEVRRRHDVHRRRHGRRRPLRSGLRTTSTPSA